MEAVNVRLVAEGGQVNLAVDHRGDAGLGQHAGVRRPGREVDENPGALRLHAWGGSRYPHVQSDILRLAGPGPRVRIRRRSECTWGERLPPHAWRRKAPVFSSTSRPGLRNPHCPLLLW